MSAPPCCDLHGRNCEPPSELCCRECTEARHAGWTDEHGRQRYGHPAGEECSAPIVSPLTLPEQGVRFEIGTIRPPGPRIEITADFCQCPACEP